MIPSNIFKINKLFNKLQSSSVVHNFSPSDHILKGDSGATSHYIAPDAFQLLTNVHDNTNIHVQLPDNTTLSSTKTGMLNIPKLSTTAKTAHFIPGLHNTSLMSLGQLADDGCVILLNKHYLNVFKNFELILHGVRNNTDGLWDIPFPNINPSLTTKSNDKIQCHTMNVITPKNQPTKHLIQYLHATLGSPSKSTLLHAIRNNHLIGWPGLTVKNVNKYLTETPATAKGHLDQHRKNLQSTTNTNRSTMYDDTKDFSPLSESTKSNQALATIIDQSETNKAYFDLTGQFPYVSTRGYKYIFILYDYDSNAILSEPLKTRNAGEIKNAWLKLHFTLSDCGIKPSTYIMDNEAANEIKQAIKKYKVSYQLTPPHIHRINAAERAIRTFKNHFLSCLASVDPNYPINEWDRLLPQAQITLNLLRTSRLHKHLSAYAVLNGHYDFNKHPMAPPGTKVVVHVKPNKQAAWGYHGEDGFYIGPALEHYRCVQCLMKNTRHVRISDTVQFFPHTTPFPTITLSDRLLNALDNIVSTLASPAFKLNHPTLQYDDTTILAIQVVANMLHRMIPKPPLPPPVPLPPEQIWSKTHSSSPSVTVPKVANVPRVEKISKMTPPTNQHPHTILKNRANSQVQVQPAARSLIKRLLHIYNKQTGKK